MMNILIGIVSYVITSFFSLSFVDINGNNISMESFKGKKVFIVNIATNSNKIAQLADIQTLQQDFKDSLVVIVFPSNSFGNESRSNAQIKQFCDTSIHHTFIIAAKSNVAGNDINEIHGWLASKASNGELDAPVQTDFSKFLIDRDGQLIGIFSSKIRATDPDIIHSITN